MSYPNNLSYTKDHEWLSMASKGAAKVGITAFALEQLGDIVHVDLPEVGSTYSANEAFGTIESTKTVSDLYMPGECRVLGVNKKITENPELIQKDVYKDGWLIEVEIIKASQGLMDASSYQSYIADDGG